LHFGPANTPSGLLIYSFLMSLSSRMHSDPKFGQRGWGVSHINARKKRFQNAIPACILQRKNYQKSVPAQRCPCWGQSSVYLTKKTVRCTKTELQYVHWYATKLTLIVFKIIIIS
jgi:hypothetical protein